MKKIIYGYHERSENMLLRGLMAIMRGPMDDLILSPRCRRATSKYCTPIRHYYYNISSTVLWFRSILRSLNDRPLLADFRRLAARMTKTGLLWPKKRVLWDSWRKKKQISGWFNDFINDEERKGKEERGFHSHSPSLWGRKHAYNKNW